jgi:hypothetical protein
MNKRKFSYLSILFLSVLFLQAASVNAHAPASIDLEYDFETQVLTVQVSHSVTNPSGNYIIQIVVEKNSVEFTTRDYTSQPTTAGMSDTFDVPAIDGDVLTVTAVCNIVGQDTNSVTVSDPSSTTTTTTTTTDTTTSTSTETTTTSGSTTSPTPPAVMDSTLIVVAVVAGIGIIVLAVVFVKRG